MMKKLPWHLITFIIGMVFGGLLILANLWTGGLPSIPSQRAVEFAGICTSLTGQELTAENISKLNGVCWVEGSIERCGGQLLSSLEKGTPYFGVYHKAPDNAWVCNINKSEDGKIRSGLSYQYD